MLVSAFEIKLGHQIQLGQVTCGKFDGKSPSLACATTGGKILLHSPHEKAIGADGRTISSIKFLNFNRSVTAIGSGQK
jgi:Bardet-Biedl syndrome 2 protein